MLVLLSVLLLSSHVLPLVQSLTCDKETEYLNNNRCCKKCEPGQLMVKRCEEGSDTLCHTCGDGYFVDEYNENYRWCPECKTCTKEYMKYEKYCTPKSNAVCTCEEGYRCSDSKCEMCVKVPATTTFPPPVRPAATKTAPHTQDMKDKKNCTPNSNAVCTCEEGYRCSDIKCEMCVKVQTTTTSPPPVRPAATKTAPHTQDNVWISVSLCFCMCVCVRSVHLFPSHQQTCTTMWMDHVNINRFLVLQKSYSGSSQCTQEEEVPMPVQEVCGKTEKLEDV